ncbi:MAG: T9SS type A sorting domain-containing protein [Candidatus Aphodosoma sp.]
MSKIKANSDEILLSSLTNIDAPFARSSSISPFDTVYITEENPWVENFDATTALTPFPSCINILQSNIINDVVYPIVVDTSLATTMPAALLMRGTNTYALPIVVAPNPVHGGQSTFVNREWTAEEQSGMRVDVLNSVGQVVEVFTPTTFPIEVGGIYVSGIYYIRVTTGTGDIYLGRLIVK